MEHVGGPKRIECVLKSRSLKSFSPRFLLFVWTTGLVGQYSLAGDRSRCLGWKYFQLRRPREHESGHELRLEQYGHAGRRKRPRARLRCGCLLWSIGPAACSDNFGFHGQPNVCYERPIKHAVLTVSNATTVVIDNNVGDVSVLTSTRVSPNTTTIYTLTAWGLGGGPVTQTVMVMVTAPSVPWSGIIDPSRAINWSQAGVPGGIPNRTVQCGPTIAAYTGTADAINNAIAACSAGQFVQLGAGTFHLSSGITWWVNSPVNNVTLRGMGANQTSLVFTGDTSCNGLTSLVCIAGTNSGVGNPQNVCDWTAGYSRGQLPSRCQTAALPRQASGAFPICKSEVSGCWTRWI